jgi:hypothetical protein
MVVGKNEQKALTATLGEFGHEPTQKRVKYQRLGLIQDELEVQIPTKTQTTNKSRNNSNRREHKHSKRNKEVYMNQVTNNGQQEQEVQAPGTSFMTQATSGTNRLSRIGEWGGYVSIAVIGIVAVNVGVEAARAYFRNPGAPAAS